MLDDIIVYSKTVEEHTEHLSQILAALDEARIFMKPSKCAFFLDSVVYLSHVVSANGIAPCRFILDAVEKFPEPKSVTEIRGFLGLCNYYRKLVRDFSEIARPLTDATKKGQAGFACLNAEQKLPSPSSRRFWLRPQSFSSWTQTKRSCSRQTLVLSQSEECSCSQATTANSTLAATLAAS